MTWLKIGEEFTRETRHLSDAAFRTHVEGLAWALDRETGGELAERDVSRFAETEDAAAAVNELVDAGYWQRTRTGYLIGHHMDEQPSPQYLQDKRRNNAQRQARYREREALKAQGLSPEQIDDVLVGRGYPSAGRGSNRRSAADEVTRGVTRYATRYPERNGTERSGTERAGSPLKGKQSNSDEEVTSWATVTPGSSPSGICSECGISTGPGMVRHPECDWEPDERRWQT